MRTIAMLIAAGIFWKLINDWIVSYRVKLISEALSKKLAARLDRDRCPDCQQKYYVEHWPAPYARLEQRFLAEFGDDDIARRATSVVRRKIEEVKADEDSRNFMLD